MDSLGYPKSISHTRLSYTQQMGTSVWLFNGKAYEPYWHGVSGHPFLFAEPLPDGILYYGGTLYEAVPIRYDLLRDEVIYRSPIKNTDIALVGDKIS